LSFAKKLTSQLPLSHTVYLAGGIAWLVKTQNENGKAIFKEALSIKPEEALPFQPGEITAQRNVTYGLIRTPYEIGVFHQDERPTRHELEESIRIWLTENEMGGEDLFTQKKIVACLPTGEPAPSTENSELGQFHTFVNFMAYAPVVHA
jgi:hypothetical protein